MTPTPKTKVVVEVMPPVKSMPTEQPNTPKQTVADRLLVNMRLIREWYRSQPHSGREIGHIVMLELVAADVVSALELAIEGKTWQPPK